MLAACGVRWKVLHIITKYKCNCMLVVNQERVARTCEAKDREMCSNMKPSRLDMPFHSWFHCSCSYLCKRCNWGSSTSHHNWSKALEKPNSSPQGRQQMKNKEKHPMWLKLLHVRRLCKATGQCSTLLLQSFSRYFKKSTCLFYFGTDHLRSLS